MVSVNRFGNYCNVKIFLLFLRKKHYELLFSRRHLMAITNITVKNATRSVMLIKD